MKRSSMIKTAGPDDPTYESGPLAFVPASSPRPSAPLDLQNLPFDPAEVALLAQEEAYLLREAGASAVPGPDRPQ